MQRLPGSTLAAQLLGGSASGQNAFRGAGAGAGRPAMGGYERPREMAMGPVSLLQLQIGLLASAKDLQSDLRQLASSADTSNSSGLQRVLQDTTLALLRQPD